MLRLEGVVGSVWSRGAQVIVRGGFRRSAHWRLLTCMGVQCIFIATICRCLVRNLIPGIYHFLARRPCISLSIAAP